MIYTIEFELPDNETVIKNIKTARVSWSVWGYSGVTHAQPTADRVARDISTILQNEQDMRVIERNAQAEIIRCRDCKHYDTHDHRCKHWNHGVEIDDYCSRAERRTDERTD